MDPSDIISSLADDATQVLVANADAIPPQQVQATSKSVTPGVTVAGIPQAVWWVLGGLGLILGGVVVFKAVG